MLPHRGIGAHVCLLQMGHGVCICLSIFTLLDAQSVVVNFNDTRCGDGRGVCQTDPLLFTCMVTGATANRITVKIENVLDIDLNDDNTIDGNLPDGFIVQSHNVQTNGGSLDYILVLSIVSASLLNGSLIICDSNIFGVDDGMAGCPVAGKFNIIQYVC